MPLSPTQAHYTNPVSSGGKDGRHCRHRGETQEAVILPQSHGYTDKKELFERVAAWVTSPPTETCLPHPPPLFELKCLEKGEWET